MPFSPNDLRTLIPGQIYEVEIEEFGIEATLRGTFVRIVRANEIPDNGDAFDGCDDDTLINYGYTEWSFGSLGPNLGRWYISDTNASH